MSEFRILHCKGVMVRSGIGSLTIARRLAAWIGNGKILLAPSQSYGRKLFIFGNIFATKERKERIDNNLYGLFSLRSFVLFCGKSVFGCVLAAARLWVFALRFLRFQGIAPAKS
jgi:hypothetical protein